MSKAQANPIPSDGIVDRLTGEQTTKLKEFWKVFLRIVHEAPKYPPGSANGDTSNQEHDLNGMNGVDSSPPPLTFENEIHVAREVLKKHGSKRFMESFWRWINQCYADTMVLKFLRARKWQIGAAINMLVVCIQWRIESGVEDIDAWGEEGLRDAEGFIKQLEMGKAYAQGSDRFGRPVCYIHVRLHKLFDQSAKALEDFILFQMENLRFLITYPNDKFNIVFDMAGFGFSNMDWKCVHFIVKCLEAYYPESLNILFIHNAPWIFQGIWKILGPMIDADVRAKVHFTRSPEDLKVHIDEKHLIKQLGGTSDWKWEYDPIVPGENDKMKDEATKKELAAERNTLLAEFERVTRLWIASPDPNISKARRVLDNLLRIQSFALDPYVRGRGIYHRKGNIVGDGRVVFEYPGLADGDAREMRGEDKAIGALEGEVRDLLRDLDIDGANILDKSKLKL
ncbi:CRAL/TRIO domain-containing protein [Rickenella mellea]|uniref:CRAL/TRIO domain-containing protein n=1 Tax=Rickenella mellea TaxID=50990 RepID=A0A4Y7PN46_9AGAM|nr:CRAL/TRIO domain-containing protein [Rickenella mellea]